MGSRYIFGMRILVTGATGLIGRRLLEVLRDEHDIRVLSRNKVWARSVFSAEVFQWSEDSIEEGALDGVDVVIHLAGERVAARWSLGKKEQILESRRRSSRLLVESIRKLPKPPKKLISASAVGIYGDRGEEKITVASSLGNGFLADVCKLWEDSILGHGVDGMRAHCIRVGVVLAREGGALQKMLPAFRMGIGGRLGDGKQYMSWIHIDDLVEQFIFLMKGGEGSVYNGTAPHPVSNRDFTRVLGEVLGRPTVLHVPSFILRVGLGEMSDMLLKGQRVLPEQFLQEGIQFKFPKLQEALQDICSDRGCGERYSRGEDGYYHG